jgi:hypothetical protein
LPRSTSPMCVRPILGKRAAIQTIASFIEIERMFS